MNYFPYSKMILINLNNLNFLLNLFFDNDIIHFYLYSKYKTLKFKLTNSIISLPKWLEAEKSQIVMKSLRYSKNEKIIEINGLLK